MARIGVRARAVDLLGRQQIAGIPTAIHELFKNAHDAYAQNVEVDFFRADQTFLLRDDGYGMTREDFEEKWLTLGTESKLDKNLNQVPNFLPANTPIRPIMGEKGIGRLAVSTIGPQTLVLTRAIRGKSTHDLVVGFVHWGLFEVPGINLEEIEIPIIELPNGDLPGQSEVDNLKDSVYANIKALTQRVPAAKRDSFIKELENFTIYPADVEPEEGPSLIGKGHGTHFYIMPSNPILEDDIDAEGSEGVAPPLIKILLGFTDTLGNSNRSAVLQTVFRDHKTDGDCVNLIGPNEFFTSKDFETVDQQFDGRFDEKGRFEGTVTIFGSKPQKYELDWPPGMGLVTDCGPFTISFAAIQGNPKESLIAPEEWGRLNSKLSLIGGLYVFKDGIRVLPYGSPDYDFLNIESRRSKSASDWYFSHRRMFGAIRLTHDDNPELKEKAGREGFISNRAYRQMRDILENLLRQLAIDFFRKDAPMGEEFRRQRDENKARNKDLEEREERIRKQKDYFEKSLEQFFEAIEADRPSTEVSILEKTANDRAERIRKKGKTKSLGSDLANLERSHRSGIQSLRKKYTLKRAQGFAISAELGAAWRAYQEKLEDLEYDLFRSSEARIAKLVTDTARAANAFISLEEATREALDQASGVARRTISTIDKETKRRATDLSQAILAEAKLRTSNVTRAVAMALSELNSLDFESLESGKALEIRQTLEGRIRRATSENVDALEGLLAQLDAMLLTLERGQSLGDQTAALESALIEITAERDLYSDLAQVGTALSVIHHEFGSTIKQVRKHIRRLGAWRNADEDLGDIYDGIRESFEHLDGYLGLFAPLNRRIQRKSIPIQGEDIRKYLWSIFEDRLTRHHVELRATEDFDRCEIEAYPSTLYPAFLNLTDNAIYWITSKRGGTRQINLDADEEGYIITNTGPGIPVNRKDWIFDFANTMKSGGRGMGLYISKQTLQRENFDLVLENPGKDNPPCFRILFPDRSTDT